MTAQPQEIVWTPSGKTVAWFPLLQADADRIELAIDQLCAHIQRVRENSSYRVNAAQIRRMKDRLRHAAEMVDTLEA